MPSGGGRAWRDLRHHVALLLLLLLCMAGGCIPAAGEDVEWRGCPAERDRFLAAGAGAGAGEGAVGVVVSYCKESLEWTFRLLSCDKHKVYIYLKCGQRPTVPEALRRCTQFRKMANVGKANAAYVQYVVDHYRDLNRVTAFIKGNAKSLLNRGQLAQLSGAKGRCTGFANLSKKRGRVVTSERESRGFYRLGRKDCKSAADCPRREVLCSLLASYSCARCEPQGWMTGFGSLFAVSRRRLLARPSGWYKEAMGNMSVSSFTTGGTQLMQRPGGLPERLHEALGSPSTYERLWNVVFGCWDRWAEKGKAGRVSCSDCRG